MIKVAVFTTVWQRPLVTSFHFEWMEDFKRRCKKLDIEIIPFYVLSEDDPHQKLFKQELDDKRFHYTTNGRKRLSNKSQAGLKALRNTIQFDWLLHLDSDEVLSMWLMNRWKREMLDPRGPDWFGSKSCYFLDIGLKEAWEFEGYEDHPVKNGGTVIHKNILEHIDWELWPIGRQTGLNIMERRRIEEFGYTIQPIDTQNYYGVVELKGRKNELHSLDWFHKRNVIRQLNGKELNKLLRHHPMLRNLVG